MSVAKLIDQMYEAAQALSACNPPAALIGGLALAAHDVPRGTQDVDFLVSDADADAADAALLALGYQSIYRTENVANYRRGEEGVDLLFARREASRRLLREARPLALGIPVISVEGLIGFKLQALANAPERPHDRADIDALIRLHRDKLDLVEVKRYFELFDQTALWEQYFGAS
jgi:hypothetical protein